MLRTDVDKELENLIESGHWTKMELMARMGLPRQYYHRIVGRQHVDQKIIDLAEIMGYDVEVKFVRKRR